jgi:hypothetical protein
MKMIECYVGYNFAFEPIVQIGPDRAQKRRPPCPIRRSLRVRRNVVVAFMQDNSSPPPCHASLLPCLLQSGCSSSSARFPHSQCSSHARSRLCCARSPWPPWPNSAPTRHRCSTLPSSKPTAPLPWLRPLSPATVASGHRRTWLGLHAPPRAEPRPPASARGPARAPPPLPPPPTCLLRPMVTSFATSLTVIRVRDLVQEFD